MDNHDKLYSIAIDLQKQLGAISVETAKQSEMLKSIEIQVKKTNGRVTLLEGINAELEKEKAYVKGKTAVIATIAGAAGSVIMIIISRIVSKIW